MAVFDYDELIKSLQQNEGSETSASACDPQEPISVLVESDAETATVVPGKLAPLSDNCGSTKRHRWVETGACFYDWQPGYEGLRLHCVTHRHQAGTSTVFRSTSGGCDTLREMAESKLLTGRALTDSRRAN